MDDLARFHSKWVQIENGCKIWQGRPDAYGYGAFKVGGRNGRLYKAHRWIFIQVNGHAPEVVMHTCDTRLCVNWDGCLVAGTRPANSADMVLKGRQRRGENHPCAKLTAEAVREIRACYAQGGITYRDLGIRYGISFESVGDIIRGDQWRSVT